MRAIDCLRRRRRRRVRRRRGREGGHWKGRRDELHRPPSVEETKNSRRRRSTSAGRCKGNKEMAGNVGEMQERKSCPTGLRAEEGQRKRKGVTREVPSRYQRREDASTRKRRTQTEAVIALVGFYLGRKTENVECLH